VIKEISISNFKSIQDLSLSLGRFNVLIGSNGSGKSNILEAITFAGAASADKLDNEFLTSRGIRLSTGGFLKNALIKKNRKKPIVVSIEGTTYTIEEEAGPVPKWFVKEKNSISEEATKTISSIFFETEKIENFKNLGAKEQKEVKAFAKLAKGFIKKEEQVQFLDFIRNYILKEPVEIAFKEQFYNVDIANFIIYSPEISSLRKFEEEGQIKPLGIKGEGLFDILQIFHENYGEATINELKKYLHIIEWFDDFKASYEKSTGRKRLAVKDRFISGKFLNNDNVNEGFLFLLFYASLILSKETPSFFAIDNIEASFHPILCTELTKQLIRLSKEHNKQIIVTTHSPFVLDALDLKDPDQKLFVIRRNSEGETIADSIDKPLKNIKLSDAWLRGYIGGHPETIE
jgi:predicted ATPase